MKKHLQKSQASIQLRQRRTSLHPLFLLLSLIFFLLSSSALAEIRYVSKTGSSTPPYTSWETAADSIQKCIDISQFGDTIYVANGVYKEQIVMIPGLSLIGAGMDSCVIDTKELATYEDFQSVTVKDSCLFTGFQVSIANQEMGYGIACTGKGGVISLNKAKNGINGIICWDYTDFIIEKNICENNKRSILLASSNSIITQNYLYSDYFANVGVLIYDFAGETTNIITNNYIETKRFGVQIAVHTKYTLISNNFIVLNDPFAKGYVGGNSDSVKLSNNIIIARTGQYGIANSIKYTLNYNNQLFGRFNESSINAETFNVIINNNVTDGKKGIAKDNPNNMPLVKYNNSWDNETNYGGFTPDSTNLSVDPMIFNDDTSKGELDFHLQMFSPLIDAGDPNILDKDGSRSDIGVFGGPYGEKYTYRDLAPKPPSNLTAEYDSGLVKLTWNRNTEADFFHYRVYRDTVPEFMYDTTKIIAVLPDTVYYDELPEIYLPGNYYYKITALDSTGHQSAPSEEVHVNITGVPEGPPVVVEHYQLLNNYPNPFNPSTIIPYRLKEGGHVKLVVYTTLGEEVAILVDHYQPKGYYEAEFNPTKYQRRKGSFGNGLSFPTGYNDDIATGIYIYRLIVSDSYWETKFVASGKMMLLK